MENQLKKIASMLSPFEGKYHKIMTTVSASNKNLFKSLRNLKIGALGPI